MPSLFSRLSYRLNRLAIWKATINVGRSTLYSSSFDRVVYLLLHKWGLMGRSDCAIFDRLVRPGMRIIDVGANIGLVTTQFASRVGPSGHVYAYEPVSELRACLTRAVETNDASNVEIFPCAVGSTNGELSMTLHSLNSGDNRAHLNQRAGDRSIQVPVERLDHRFTPGSIDLVKIDVQGFEPEVFRGMTALLAYHLRPVIYFEVSLPLLKKNAFTADDVTRPLVENNYTFSLWDESASCFSTVTAQEITIRAEKSLYFNVLAEPVTASTTIPANS